MGDCQVFNLKQLFCVFFTNKILSTNLVDHEAHEAERGPGVGRSEIRDDERVAFGQSGFFYLSQR